MVLAEVSRLFDLAVIAESEAGYNAPLVELQSSGSRVVLEYALEQSRDSRADHRITAVRVLGELSCSSKTSKRAFPEECCDRLLEMVQAEHDELVAVSAVYALGHLGNRRSDGPLSALRKHSSDHMRSAIAFALGGTSSEAGVEALLEMMNDPCESVRDWATAGIGQSVEIDGHAIRSALLRRADDESVFVRAEALHGLVIRHDRRVVPYLIRELSASSVQPHLFLDSAKCYLGVQEEDEVDREDVCLRLSKMLP